MPEFESSIFTIKNFTQVQKIKNIVYSDEVFLSFVKWRFKVYPNGMYKLKNNINCFQSLYINHEKKKTI